MINDKSSIKILAKGIEYIKNQIESNIVFKIM